MELDVAVDPSTRLYRWGQPITNQTDAEVPKKFTAHLE